MMDYPALLFLNVCYLCRPEFLLIRDSIIINTVLYVNEIHPHHCHGN